MAMMPHVLIVAGSDSSGGAGLARDIETVSAVGLRACLAVTAITVQTHEAVERIEPVAPELIAAQMRAALAANPVAAIKIGMLGTAAGVDAVAAVLGESRSVPVVLDPVLASSSGRALLAGDAVESLRQKLLSLCAMVTPNLPELALLTGAPAATDRTDLIRQGHLLLEAGAKALLVKGGHATGAGSTDLLLRPNAEPVCFDAPRIAVEMRGTGCMLASAIAAYLARGETLETSVSRAKRYVFTKLLASRT